MNELIKISETKIGEELIQTVSARDLHEYLDSKAVFGNWIKDQIDRADLTQAIDFTVINNFITDETAFGGKRKIKDYYLTIDAGKNIAMMSGTVNGKEVRKYFIECEKIAKASSSPVFNIPTTFAEALRLAADTQDELDKAKAKIEREKPLVDFAVSVAKSDGTLDVGAFGKIIGCGRNKLFAKLREMGYLMDGGKGKKNLPYQEYMDRNYFEVVEETFEAGGKKEINLKTVITGKGQVVLEKKLRATFIA